MKQQLSISRRLGSPAAALTSAKPELNTKQDATNLNEHARLRRLTLELSGSINREAIDLSA